MRIACRSDLVVGILTVACAASGQAQRPDSTLLPLTTSYQWSGAGLDSLPVDSLRTALGFLPGVSPGSRGDLYVRGGSPDELVTYIDGVPVQPGVRGGGLGTSVGPVTPWTAGLNSAELTTGPYGSSFGNGASGLLRLITRSGGDRWNGGVRYSTDELSGKAASFGVNRIEGTIGGPLGRNVRLFFGAFVHGQQSATSGLDGAAAPIFVPAGVDTTLAVPSAYGSPTADTQYVAAANWAVFRGDCSQFSHNPDPGVAGNYGAACQGDRIPMSASTSARYQLRLDATPDDRTELWFSALGGRDQARLFGYNLVQDAQAMTAVVNDSRVWTLGLRRSLTPAVRVEAALSLQHDQSQNGPLDPTEELNTRDPFGGFLIAPLRLRFNLSNFPVDQQLVTNYRENIFNSRRSPYDLNNTSQYGYIDQWRNNAYGLLGYAEGGGPAGRLSLYRETRIVGRAAVEWRSPGAGTIRFGMDGTRYDIANYSHVLVTQIFSDVWIEKPITSALYLGDRFSFADGTFQVGLRYDRFATGALRPWLLDTSSFSPTFGQYGPFPRTSTYGVGPNGSIQTFNGQPLLVYRSDATHSALGPDLALTARLDDRTTIHAAFARQVQVPDFDELFSSINTDLQLTNTQQVWGSDAGFLDATLFEAGASRSFRHGWVASLTGYHRRNTKVWEIGFRPMYDPATKVSQGVTQGFLADGGSDDGLEVSLSRHSRLLAAELSYAYQHKSLAPGLFIPTSNQADRPHSLVAVGTLAFPHGWHNGTPAGRILEDASITILGKYASGALHFGCPRPTVVAAQPPQCPLPFFTVPVDPSRLPAFKVIDLRVSKGLDLGGHRASLFLDAHNLFNFRNYNSALTPGGATSSAEDEAIAASNDSANYASEALRNGVYNAGAGSIDLTFGGAADPRTGCGAWVTAANSPASPNCVYLIQAEQRFGNGDGIFTVAEQKNASRAQYAIARGLAALTDLPRRIRIGIEITL